MKITLQYLKKHHACDNATAWFLSQHEKDLFILFKRLAGEGKPLEWGNWLLSKKLCKLNKIRYAVFAAEQVLPLFTQKYPDDDRPVAAIEAAKNYIKNPTKKNADAAAYAAADAADAAHAAHAAAYAAYAAAHAAHAAAKREMQIKIINYGLTLLKR